jgi:DEAD/DEAH box helicase domain-containing protein
VQKSTCDKTKTNEVSNLLLVINSHELILDRLSVYEPEPCGVTRQLYKFFDPLLTTCLQQIKECDCKEGCPSCKTKKKKRQGFQNHIIILDVGIHLFNCSEHNQVCSKKGALIIFYAMVNGVMMTMT